ncbi:MAG TPA: hypothetical protein VI141_08255 [Acidimicrobiia bacterium]
MTTSNNTQKNRQTLDPATTRLVFDDPVSYLGSLGVAATLVAVTTFPAAA